MKISSETEMLTLGRLVGKQITLPAVFELIGDVGTGKTTFTRGLAEGLGIAEAITSPSFTISKRYGFARPKDIPAQDHNSASVESNNFSTGELIHYDFYRLNDPGIMRDELAEALSQLGSVIVVEWGGDVADLLPESKYQLKISLNEDDSRTIEFNQNAFFLEKIWQNYRTENKSHDTATEGTKTGENL